jgi:hypothetical protein
VNLLNLDPDPERVASALSKQYGIALPQALSDVRAVVSSVRNLGAVRENKGRHPTVAGVTHVARSWWRQPWTLRLTIFEVTLVVAAIEVGLKLTDVSRLGSLLGVPLGTDEVPPPAAGPDDLSGLSERKRRAYWSVDWVMQRWLYDGTCLRRALALGWMLRDRHPVLRLGMIDNAEMVAHAWIEVDGKAFGAQEVKSAFVSGHAGSRGSGSWQKPADPKSS